MTNVIKMVDDDQVIQDQAAEWVVILDEGNITNAQRADLEAWVQKSSLHKRTLQELIQVWNSADILENLSEVFPLEEFYVRKQEEPEDKNWFFGKTAVASVLILAVVTVGYLATNNSYLGNMQLSALFRQTTFQTSKGGLESIQMQDGSKVTLNTDTQINADYDKDKRLINLSRGEAYFDVAHDESKPFIVEVGEQQVIAVGTAFSVRKKKGSIEVTVTDGAVEIVNVTADSEQKIKKHRVSKGQIAQIDDEHLGQVTEVKSEQLAKVFMWQKQMISFHGDPLKEVISEFSRYSDASIIIADAEIEHIRVGGYFSTNDLEGMLDALSQNFDIRVDKVDANTFKLTKTDI